MTYTYPSDGVNLTGAWEYRSYDGAGRLETVEHWDSTSVLRLYIVYTWNLDNTVAQKTEYDGTVSPERTVTVDYTYDRRRRLIEESAVTDADPPVTAYHYLYEYDPLGNRTCKYDAVPERDRLTYYAYDTDWDGTSWRSEFVPWIAAQTFETRNNRLAEYREYGPAVEGTRPLERTVYYTYQSTGHVSHITVKDEGFDTVKDLYLVYSTDERLGLVIPEEWRYDPNDPHRPWTSNFNPDPNNPNEGDKVTAAIEFRYESGRQRYLYRVWNTHGWDSTSYWTVSETAWTDYLGDEPYVDYGVTLDGGNPVPEEQVRWLAGLGIRGREGVGESGPPTRFMHGDLIGSTMLETGPTGEVESSGGWTDSNLWQYTAFGEPIWPLATGGIERTADSGRYKYAGAYGYESGMFYLWGANEELPPIMLQHVGERWYEPGTGRFIQRDPIGVDGGLNVYAYVKGDPLTGIDPDGLSTDDRQWVDPKINPPLPVSPRAKMNPPPDSLFLCITGGRDSWVDHPKTVKRVQLVVKIPVTILSWVPGVGWTLKVVLRTFTFIGWVQEANDLW